MPSDTGTRKPKPGVDSDGGNPSGGLRTEPKPGSTMIQSGQGKGPSNARWNPQTGELEGQYSSSSGLPRGFNLDDSTRVVEAPIRGTPSSLDQAAARETVAAPVRITSPSLDHDAARETESHQRGTLANAPSKRIRFRAKQRERVDHEAVLGPEPLLREPADADGRHTDDDPPDEAVPTFVGKSVPKKPGHEELARHMVTHMPHRAWCDICVAARGVDGAHRRPNPFDASDAPRGAEVAFDWAFMRDHAGSQLLNVLVGVDKRSSCKFTLVASDRTSTNERTVQAIIAGLKRLGHHGTLTIKTDGEPSLQELMSRVAAGREGGHC